MLIENQPGVEQRQHGMYQNLVHLDHGPHDAIEAAMLGCFRQADAKYLQQPAHLVRQINGLVQQGFPCAQQCPNAVRLPALHMNRAEPTRPQDLGDAAGIVAICLVAHRGERGADLARLHADNIEPFRLQSVEQMLAQGAGLEPDALDRNG